MISAAQLAVLQASKNASAASAAGLSATAETASTFFLSLCRAVTEGRLAPEKVPLAIQAVGLDAALASVQLTDVLWCGPRSCTQDACRALTLCRSPRRLLSVRLEGEASAEPRARLLSLARVCLEGGYVSRAALLENCEGEFLEELGLIKSASDFKKKEVRVNTKVVYNQQKFNLLREQSEGYAKVLTVLNNSGAAALSAATLPAVVKALQALIGYFDLDPNRVFDLVLDRRAPRCTAAVRKRRRRGGVDEHALHSSF